jgi:hypothetical protein
MMELFILDKDFIQFRPSVIAVSSIFLALYTNHCNPWVSAQPFQFCGFFFFFFFFFFYYFYSHMFALIFVLIGRLASALEHPFTGMHVDN